MMALRKTGRLKPQLTPPRSPVTLKAAGARQGCSCYVVWNSASREQAGQGSLRAMPCCLWRFSLCIETHVTFEGLKFRLVSVSLDMESNTTRCTLTGNWKDRVYKEEGKLRKKWGLAREKWVSWVVTLEWWSNKHRPRLLHGGPTRIRGSRSGEPNCVAWQPTLTSRQIRWICVHWRKHSSNPHIASVSDSCTTHMDKELHGHVFTWLLLAFEFTCHTGLCEC